MQTLGDSAPAYSTVAKCHAEFHRGRISCDDIHCYGHQWTSMKEETAGKSHKLLTDDRRLSVLLQTLMTSLLIEYIQFLLIVCWRGMCLKDGRCECRLTFRRQVCLTHQRICSTSIMKNMTIFSGFLYLDEACIHHFNPESKSLMKPFATIKICCFLCSQNSEAV